MNRQRSAPPTWQSGSSTRSAKPIGTGTPSSCRPGSSSSCSRDRPPRRILEASTMPAPMIDELLIADDSERWREFGFAVADGRCQIGRVRVRFLTGGAKRGIVGWSLRDVAHTELDGLATTISEQPAPDAAPAHPNGAVAIDHIVGMPPSLARSVGALQRAGLDLRRIREQPTPAGAPRQAFFRLGGEILELIQEPYELLERTGGRGGPARFWGVAVRVDDL